LKKYLDKLKITDSNAAKSILKALQKSIIKQFESGKRLDEIIGKVDFQVLSPDDSYNH